MNVNKKMLGIKDLTTNKMLWNKFNKNFDNALKMFNSNNNEELLELNETQYHQLLFNLGMVSYKIDKEENIDEENKNENNDQNNPEPFIENPLKLEENKLIKESFNLLKIDKDKDTIKINDIKNFLIFVLNIQNYHLYYQFKTNHTSEELKNIFPSDKFKKEEIPELMLKMQNDALQSEIDKSKSINSKYYYISKNGEIIFTLDKASVIKKDFNIFSLNYRNQKQKTNGEEKIINYIKKMYPFKPKINEKSEKIYQKHKDKIYMTANDTYTTNSQYKKTNLEYIDRILLLDKKRIAENQKIGSS